MFAVGDEVKHTSFVVIVLDERPNAKIFAITRQNVTTLDTILESNKIDRVCKFHGHTRYIAATDTQLFWGMALANTRIHFRPIADVRASSPRCAAACASQTLAIAHGAHKKLSRRSEPASSSTARRQRQGPTVPCWQ
ncbi:hypothetical protein GE300_11450 [Rhodobacteraceae bacterium 2CG4]|uniref:Uncharacterized protein n=1 Tax=Halovulum marinum TaxID=2662447 RepID=A0A6L5Z0X8_9RHOB|nr:hypothetical protein [Halovulum marinum]MSU90226.1 hypothetical protein [Halovulum marinum]